MKTPTERTVEEIVKGFRTKFAPNNFIEKDEEEVVPLIEDWLTQTLQAERQRCEEVVEIGRNEIEKVAKAYLFDQKNNKPTALYSIKVRTLTQPNNNS